MIAVIQRVSQASVIINSAETGKIGMGQVILLGIEENDNDDDINWLSNKIVNLRIFDDHNGVMNLGVKEVNGEILVVSQFTLHASTKKGNRPSYIKAAKPDIAIPIYDKFIKVLEQQFGKVETGEFGANMDIQIVNQGPVTIIIDTKDKK